MPMSIGAETEVTVARDRPLIRRLALPSGTPFSASETSIVPETRPLTSKRGKAIASSASETRSNVAFSRRWSPNWPSTSSLPSGVTIVTGARTQPPAVRVTTAGADRVIGRRLTLPLAAMVMRPGSKSASALIVKGMSALPLAVIAARPFELAKSMLPLLLSMTRSPRRTLLTSKRPVTLGPVPAGSSTTSDSEPLSIDTGVARLICAAVATAVMSARWMASCALSTTLAARPRPAISIVPANGPAGVWTTRPWPVSPAMVSFVTSMAIGEPLPTTPAAVNGP